MGAATNRAKVTLRHVTWLHRASVSRVLIKSCISFRKRKGDEVDGTDEVAKKKSKKGKDKDSSKLEKALKAQTELIWNIKDELKKACSTNDLKELLIFNQQQVPSGESAVSALCCGGHTRFYGDVAWH